MASISPGMHSNEIFRGHVYWTAIPFSSPKPLIFFEECSLCDDKENCPNRQETCGKATEKVVGFSTDMIEEDESNEMVIPLIVKHKIRPALVIQKDFYNHDDRYESVIVLPIQSLNRSKRTQGFLKKYDQNLIPQIHSIGTHTGREAYVNLSDIKRVHKSYLLSKFNCTPLSEDTVKEICMKISDLLEIKEIPACRDCKMNCNNCVYKKQAVNE